MPQILIADDAPLVRWAARRALGAAGFRVVEAQTRAQVLEAFVSYSFQVVVLSLALAGDDMEDIVRAVASAAGSTGLILLTENGMIPGGLLPHPRVRTFERPFSIAALVDAAVSLAGIGLRPTGESVSP